MSEKTLNFLLATVVPLVCAIGLIAMSIWGVGQKSRAESYQLAAENMYKRAYNDLNDELNKLSVTLDKMNAVNSKTQYLLLLDDIWRSSGSISSLLSQIPSSHVDALATKRFITQVGDFAHSLSKKLLKGAALSDDDLTQINGLRETCGNIQNKVSTKLNDNSFPIEQLSGEAFYETESGEYKNKDGIDEFPTLIYDGPFSESTEKAEAKGVTGERMDENACRDKALSCIPDGSTLELSSDNNGTIPAFDFHGLTPDGREIDISISKLGGSVVYFMTSVVGSEEGKPDDASVATYKDAGKKYLDEHGYAAMEATYGQYYGGVALISFAATQNGVILYSDLVKVYADRETSEIVGIDARNYLFSHVERDIKEPEISLEDARRAINSSLQIVSERLAFIPLTPTNEVLCYEFKTVLNDTSYIVYINAENGDEEQVYMVIDSEDGSLVL